MARYPKKDGPTMGHHAKPAGPVPLARWEDSTAAQQPSSRGTTRRHQIPIPEAAAEWHPQARSWFNSLRLSGQSEFYEASDWATAVIAAQLYDHYIRSRSYQIFNQFARLSARLGVTVADRRAARIELEEPGEPTDYDEEAADEAVVAWHGRLGLVKDRDNSRAESPGSGSYPVRDINPDGDSA